MPDPRNRRLSKEEKAQVKQLHLQGLSRTDIANRLNCGPYQVGGIVNTAQFHGRMPGPEVLAPAGFSPVQETQPPLPEPVEAPVPDPVRIPVPEVTVTTSQRAEPPQQTGYDPASFGFNFVAGSPGSVSNYVSQPIFRVERTTPAHGYMGMHIGLYDPEKVANTYGSGVYRITLRLPGHKQEYVSEYQVSENYGPPKFPAREEEERHARPQPRPGYGHGPVDPYPYPRPPADWSPRAPVVVGEAAAQEAIRQMGDLQRSFLARESEERKAGPGPFLQDLMRQQASDWARLRQEDRDREETRLRAEEARRLKDREDREDQWKRDRLEADDRHAREMTRIQDEEKRRMEREERERKFLLDLQDRRFDAVKADSASRERALTAELDAKRREADKEIAQARKEMEALDHSVAKQLAENKKDLDKEYELRREMLEKESKLITEKMNLEQKLLGEKLELQTQIATANTTESLVKGAKDLVAELRKGVDAVLDHKKMEMGLQPGPGNVTTLPDRRRAEQPAAAPASEAEGATDHPEAQDMNGQGDFIGQFIKDPGGRQIVSEWARQVRSQVPPGSFVGFFLDGYQDPVDHGFRKACRFFSVYIRTRNWAEMKAALDPHVGPEEREAFASEWAEDFYEGFRTCFFEEVDGFYEQVAARKAARAAESQPAAAKEEAKG